MQDKIQKALSDLTPKTVKNLLNELLKLRRRFNNGEDVEVPLTTLHFRSGRDMKGWVMGLAEDCHDFALLFQLIGGDGRPSHDIVYLQPGDVEAITVHNAGRILHLLSLGSYVETPPGSSPTKLDLKRKAEGFSQIVSEALGLGIIYYIDWETVPQSGIILLYLAEIMSDTTGVLSEIFRDNFSKETIRKSLRKIIFSNAAVPGVSLDKEILTIKSNLSKGKDGRLSIDALRSAIEKVF